MNAFHSGNAWTATTNSPDAPLQDRVSLFNTWNIARESDRVMTLGGRYIYEDRFGGDVNWVEAEHRGGLERYGESIYTHRWKRLHVPAAHRRAADVAVQRQRTPSEFRVRGRRTSPRNTSPSAK